MWEDGPVNGRGRMYWEKRRQRKGVMGDGQIVDREGGQK